MLWRRASLLACAFAAGRLLGQAPAAPTGVEQLIQQAFEHNREILAAQQRVAEARGLLRQAGVRPAPTLEVTGATGRPLGTQGEEEYSAGYFLPIETGGKRSKRLTVAEKALELAEGDLAEKSRQIAYDIKSRYIDAVASARKLDAIERIVNVNRESYRLVDVRVQRDDAAPLERQLLLVEVNRTDAQRAAAAGQVSAARSELQRVIASGLAITDISAPGIGQSAVSMSPDELRRLAIDRRPDLRIARALASQAASELSLAEAQGKPDLTLSAQYARRYSQFEDPIRTTEAGSPLLLKDQDNILTLGISIPLQSRKRNQGNMEAAAARQSAAKLRAEHLELTIPLEVQAAWQRYEAARNAVTILNRGVLDESERNLAVIRQAYNLGQLRLLDVLSEQRRLLETEMNTIDAEAELARSHADLERTVGGNLQ